MLSYTEKNESAVTLLELILSSILVGVVILGVVSIDFAIRRNQQTTSRSSILAMQTSAVMLRITKEASLAIGYESNPGIAVNADPSIKLCIRKEDNTPSTPGDYTDDTWFCFQYNAAAYNMIGCTVNEADAKGSLNPCNSASAVIDNSVQDTMSGKMANASFNWVASATDFYIGVSLTARHNPAAPRNPITNPQFILNTRVRPLSHSWN